MIAGSVAAHGNVARAAGLLAGLPVTTAGVSLHRACASGLNLETAAGRARVGRHGVGWQGMTTLRAFARKEEQRRQRATGRLNRACSVVTHKVRWVVGTKARFHAACPAEKSGQLRFLG